MKFFSRILISASIIISSTVWAGARAQWATPVQIDIERANGVMMYGNFGNANEASAARAFSMLLAAKASNDDLSITYTLNSVASDYNGWGLCTIKAIYLK
jgi:hypothetical protein